MSAEKFSGWRVLASLFIIIGVMLAVYLNFTLLIPTYIEEFGITVFQGSMISTIATLVTAVTTMFAFGPLLKKVGVRMIYVIAGVLTAIAFAIYGISNSIYVTWLAAAIDGVVLGIGLEAMTATVVNAWFMKKRAVYMSIVFSSLFLVPAIVLPLLAQLIVNIGWRETMFVVAVSAGLITIVLGLFGMREAPEKYGQKPYGYDEEMAKVAEAENDEQTLPGITLKEALKTPSFYLFFASAVLLVAATQVFALFAPTYWQSTGMDIVTSSSYVSIYNIVAMLLSFAGGLIMVKLTYKVHQVLYYIVVVAALFLLCIANGIAPMYLLALTAVLAAVGVTAKSLLVPEGTSNLFGPRYYEELIGPLTSCSPLGTAVASIVFGAVSDSLGFGAAWAAIGVMGIVGIVLFIAAYATRPVK